MGLKFETSDETCAYARSVSPIVICPFSLGKDSLATLLQLRRFWEPENIIVVYNAPMTAPDGRTLPAFIERSIAYYERQLNIRVYRLLHVQDIRMLRYSVWQPPERRATIKMLNAQRKLIELEQQWMSSRLRHVPSLKHAWHAVGIRVTDSIQRRRTIKANGSAYPNLKQFYPIWDWRIDDVIGAITGAGLKLPIDYQWFGRSFDAYDARTMRAIRDNAPEDFELLRWWFPMLDIDIYRHDVRPAVEAIYQKWAAQQAARERS